MTKYNKFQVRDGHYNWLNTSELQTQYIFFLRDDAPFDSKSFGVVVNNLAESEFDTVYDCAAALLDAVSEYIYHPDKEKVEKLVSYLEKYLYDDKLSQLFDERNTKLAEIERIDKRISSIEREMELEKSQ